MIQEDISDQQIITEILKGDHNRYGVLMQKYNRRLYRVCKGFLRSEDEIEDIMQDTYIKGFVNLKQFVGRSSFGTWITRILINESLMKIRVNGKENILSDITDNTATMNFSHNNNPEKESLTRELRQVIETNIEDLPENYRLVFVMREVEKMSVSETAEVLSITEPNVKVRLNRAKEFLRRSLLRSYPIEDLYEFNLTRCGRIAARVMEKLNEMGYTGHKAGALSGQQP